MWTMRQCKCLCLWHDPSFLVDARFQKLCCCCNFSDLPSIQHLKHVPTPFNLLILIMRSLLQPLQPCWVIRVLLLLLLLRCGHDDLGSRELEGVSTFSRR